jgi:hypothetical protein
MFRFAPRRPAAPPARERHRIILATVRRDPDLAEKEARVHPQVAAVVLRNPARSDTGQCGSRPLEVGQTNGISGSGGQHRLEIVMFMRTVAACFFLATGLICNGVAAADDQSDLLPGGRMTIIVGFSAGGGFDLYARLLARH